VTKEATERMDLQKASIPPGERLEPDPASEIDRLRRERDQLKAELEAVRVRHGRGRRARTVIAGTLVVLVVLTCTATVPAAWARRTFFNTNRYVATVAPLIDDSAVQAALTNEITTEVFRVVPVHASVQNALPDQVKFLAAPVTTAVRSFVHDQVARLVDSRAFRDVWVRAQRFAQTQIVAVLNGNGSVVSVVAGRVVLNLLPMVNAVMRQLQTTISGLVGHSVTLPTITAGMLPEAARQELSQALGIPIPSDFGAIVIFKSDQLKAAQQAFAFFNRALVFLLILDVLLIVAALWASVRRRRTLLQLLVGIGLGVIVARALSRVLERQLLDSFRVPSNRAAAQAVTSAFLHNLLAYTAWLLAIVVGIALVTAVTGPYRWAMTLRTKAAEACLLLVGTVTGSIQGEGASWVRAHVTVMEIAGVLLATILLLSVSLAWWSLLLIMGLLALYELALYRLTQRQGAKEIAGPLPHNA
jgi:hypothetical protein